MKYSFTEEAFRKLICSIKDRINNHKHKVADVEDLSELTEDDIKEICDFEEGMNEENVIPKASADLLGCVKVGDGLNVDENGVLSNKAADYIVEEGTSGSWYYRKWASGKVECMCNVTITGTTPTSFMGGYYSYGSTPLPFVIPTIHMYNANARLGTGVGWCTMSLTTTHATVHCTGNQNSSTIVAYIYILGTL